LFTEGWGQTFWFGWCFFSLQKICRNFFFAEVYRKAFDRKLFMKEFRECGGFTKRKKKKLLVELKSDFKGTQWN